MRPALPQSHASIFFGPLRAPIGYNGLKKSPDIPPPLIVLVSERENLPNADDIAALFRRHSKTVYRLSYSYLGNAADAEDATQNVFMKLLDKPRRFNDDEHEKAWLIVCAQNHCRDVLKSAHRKRTAELTDDLPDSHASAGEDETLAAVLALPAKYKTCVYLHYYEGYRTAEIALITGTPPSTVRSHLSEARALLRTMLGGESVGNRQRKA